MSISSELARIKAAKTAIRTAINAKGGELSDSAMLGDFASAVAGISTGTDFYKCASVIQAGTVSDQSRIIITGSGTTEGSDGVTATTFQVSEICGTYTLSSGTGYSRVWSNGSNKITGSDGWWIIKSNDESKTYTRFSDTVTDSPVGAQWSTENAEPVDITASYGETVNTASWSGYKLIANENNGFDLESTLTTGLVYYSKTAPVVDGIYDSTGKIKLAQYYKGDTNVPTEGLLYSCFIEDYEPVNNDTIVTEDNTSKTVETESGIPARYFNGSERVKLTSGTQRTAWSISLWIKRKQTDNTYPLYGWNDANLCSIEYSESGSAYFYYQPAGYGSPSVGGFSFNQWHHIVFTQDGTHGNCYIDNGNTIGEKNPKGTAFQDSSSFVTLGSRDNGYYFNGWIANFRYYDHALTADERAALYQEFIPTDRA